jgi:hypothetical protein
MGIAGPCRSTSPGYKRDIAKRRADVPRGQDVAACAIHDRAMIYWLDISRGAAWKMELSVGAIIFVVAVALFWYSLPRGGKTNRFVGTALEPYVVVAFCVGIGLSFILMLSGVIALMEGR